MRLNCNLFHQYKREKIVTNKRHSDTRGAFSMGEEGGGGVQSK